MRQADYLKKSKHQKTAAWIFTGVGTGVLILTAIVSPYTNVITDLAETHSVNTVPFIVGGALVATGVVFFVASAKNKKKASAASTFINMQKAPELQQTVIRNQLFPALVVRISL